MKHFCFLTGGYSRYDVLMFYRQGKSLIEAGYEVTYIVSDDMPDEIKDGIEILSTHHKPRNRFDRFINSKKHILDFALRVNADIYQISDPELISVVSTLKRKGKRVIFNLREYYPDMLRKKHYIPKAFRTLCANYYSSLMKRRLPEYDAVFTVTDWILDILQKGMNIKNAYLLTNFPVVNHNFQLSKDVYMNRPDTLCYEGTIYSSSRQENVFSALERIPQVHYILAGKIDELNDKIKQHSYWKNVEFIDGFEVSDLPAIFGRSTISNVFRDFGGRDGSLGVIKIFESMEAALPVLFADVPLYRKINEKYHCGICVNPNSVESIESAITYLVEHKEEAYQMGQNGRRAVIEEFSWDSQAKNYLSVINSL